MNESEANDLYDVMNKDRDNHENPFALFVTDEYADSWGVELIPYEGEDAKFYWQVFHTEASWQAYKWHLGWGI